MIEGSSKPAPFEPFAVPLPHKRPAPQVETPTSDGDTFQWDHASEASPPGVVFAEQVFVAVVPGGRILRMATRRIDQGPEVYETAALVFVPDLPPT